MVLLVVEGFFSVPSPITRVLKLLEFVEVVVEEGTAKSFVLLQSYHTDIVFLCFIKCSRLCVSFCDNKVELCPGGRTKIKACVNSQLTLLTTGTVRVCAVDLPGGQQALVVGVVARIEVSSADVSWSSNVVCVQCCQLGGIFHFVGKLHLIFFEKENQGANFDHAEIIFCSNIISYKIGEDEISCQSVVLNLISSL